MPRFGGGASESKINRGPGYRIYYGVDGDDVVLRRAGGKSTQAADIARSRRLWQEYQGAHEGMDKPTISYKEDLLKDLRNVEYRGEYLSASLRESTEAFLLALRNVAEAQAGKTKRAVEDGVNRENLQCILSEEKNPSLSSLAAALGASGLRLSTEPEATVNVRSRRRAVQRRPGSLRAAGLAPSGRGGPKG